MQRPSTDEILIAISAFRACCEEGPVPGDYAELFTCVLRLLEIASRMKGEDVGEETSQPKRDHLSDYKRGSARFPNLEFCNEEDIEISKTTTIFPTDDLGDIYSDICQVQGLFDDGQIQAARWEFRFSFETHWGKHALALLSYMLKTFRI